MPDEAKPDPKNPIRAVPLDDVRRARGEGKVAMPRSKVASLRAFRRVRADRGFGALGILLLFVGLALIFTWEKPPVEEKKFQVDWPQTTFKGQTFEGQRLTEGGPSATHTVQFDVPNATAILFTLSWKDDIGQEAGEADKLEIKIVKSPPGANITRLVDSNEGGPAGANVTIPAALNGIPEVPSVPAETEEQARAAVGDRTNQTGIGEWVIEVRVVSAPPDFKTNEARNNPNLCPPYGSPGSTTNPICVPDGGNTYTLEVSYVTYSMKLKPLF